ncbi:outer membrane protein assembly factor BamA [Phorcysia thermohydrogeniphila]|uniref:Outer membrane protein assembly factor BamA n=1 Tax=Phorcysia thermohydrogeniphila TaxID=936138 RepID=A0A4R1GI71_9BACT|nr:outer membrane protein assembly factor BamA [Phorcysia thermohydrogeniphila]TCK06575.1 Beta-barrel assembly machine subunit BamA [Phorcysia thermohydrogeniphila]
MRRLFVLIVVLFVSLLSPFSRAEDKQLVEKVEIIGNETVPDSTILFYISEKPGEVYSPKKVAKDIKTLFKLGYFENISVDVKEGKKGVILRYFVKEKPIITDIVFKGNKNISASKLKEELGLVDENGEEKELREPLSYKFLDDLARKIEAVYEKKGFPGTRVFYTIDRTSPTKAVATFVIEEGHKANVCTIEIRGNKAIDSGDIKDVLETKEKSLLHLRFTAPLSAANLEEDVEKIKELYHSRGYLDVEVGEPEVVKEKDDCYKVIYTIKSEGEPYRFGKIVFKGNTLFSSKELLKLFKKVRPGKTFNQELVEKLSNRIVKKYGELGFIFAVAVPEVKIHPESHTADVIFHIHEGERAYVRFINITGNVATRDRTIRRELDLYETGVFNTVRLERSVRRLFNTGYFENVDVKPKIVEGNKVDVNVNVEERLTGMFSVGAGYSSVSKLVAMVSLSKGNLFGTGDSGSLSLQAGARVFYFDLNYNHRWWLDKPQTLSLGLYNRYTEYFTYTSKRTGFSSMVSRRIWEDWKIGLGYLIERDKITDISDDAPDIIKDEEGVTKVGMATAFVSRDLRDNRFLPHKGDYFRITTQLASDFLGGDEDFYKVIGEYAYYFNLNELPTSFELPFVASFHAKVGYASAFGGTTRLPIDYRFYVGGDTTVRGFQWGEAGPQDEEGDPEGANRELIFNFEVGYDVTKILRLIAFVDVGGGWWDKYDLGDMRKSAGIGLRVLTPMGPIRLDLGWKLDKRAGESSSEWHFGMGSYF